MGDLQPLPPLLDGTDAIGDGGGGTIDDGIDVGDGGGGSPIALEENQPTAVQLPTPPNPLPSAIASENWHQAEEATRKVLRRIQPTVVSEQRRKAVVEYVQKVLKPAIGSEVYPFGSVPLKTYLPDGDIDLTAVGLLNTDDVLANGVHSALQAEEYKKDPEFEVKDLQFIHAEVKLVKCIVQNVVVDISINQIGGLSTLCFLEKVDQKIGNNNIFTRSIILIKAWCYYESRILGAHHGLISTYALETLVMYVFHLFHKSLNGPLAVLYMFLDFYSKFDWDSYCVSLHGSVLVSSLPELIVEPPEIDQSDLLFSKEFIKEWTDTFSVPSRGLEPNPRVFPQKHLNIIDPLKQTNNLGRSVSKGNFYRIRSAFTYGARQLGRILLLPAESIADEVSMFFTNTLDRHGTGARPDVQDAPPKYSENGTTDYVRFNSPSSHLKADNGYNDVPISVLAISDFNGASTEETNDINFSSIGKEHEKRMKTNRSSFNFHLDVCRSRDGGKLEPNGIIEREILSDACLSGKVRDFSSTETSTSRIMVETLKIFPSENGSKDEITDNMKSKEDTIKSAALNRTGNDEPSYETEASSSTSWSGNDTVLATSPSSSCMSEDSKLAYSSIDAKENIGNARSQKLANLSEHYQLHFRNFLHALSSQEFAQNSYYIPNLSSPSHYQNNHSWNSFQQRSMYSHIGPNGLVLGNSFSPTGYLYNRPITTMYSTKDIQPTRGTGTYFPNTNFHSYNERQSSGRGKNQMHGSNPPRSRYNGRSETLQDKGLLDEGNDEPSRKPQSPVYGGSGRVKPAPLEFSHSRYPPFKGASHSNGFAHSPHGKLDLAMLGAMTTQVSPPEQGDNSEQASSSSQDFGSRIIPLSLQKPSTSFNYERPAQPYQLRDVEDFPPLTS